MGVSADQFLRPTDGIRGEMKRAGIEPKDHMRENRQLLKEMAEVQLQRKEYEAESAEDKKRRDATIRHNSRARAQQHLADLGAYEDISGEGDYMEPPRSRGASAGRRAMTVRPPPTGQEVPPPKEQVIVAMMEEVVEE